MNVLAGIRGGTKFLRSGLLPSMRLPSIAIVCMEAQGAAHLLLKKPHFFFPAHIDSA